MEEIAKKESKYKFKCPFVAEGCSERFKTKNGMMIHRASCNCGYSTTEKKFVVGEILAVFGKASRKLYRVRWENYPDPEEDTWETEKMLLEDGCRETIDEFWERSGICRTLDFYPDPVGLNRCWMCGWTCRKSNDHRYLKTHIKRAKHKWKKRRAHLTAKRDVKKDKLEEMQNALLHVHWGDLKIENVWQFEYLGSIFQADGDQLPDIRRRVAMAITRAGQLRNIWAAPNLPLKLKLQLYKSACCSILTYGSEAWVLNTKACKIINGANASMLSHITGRSRHEEASSSTTTFNLIKWIRARRLKWVGHILRTDDDRLIKKALHHIFDHPQTGDILMDTTADDWQQLQQQASDREAWRKRVKQVAASIERNWQQLTQDVTGMLRKQRTAKTRFHIRRQALKRKYTNVKKKVKKMSNMRAREDFYQKHEAKCKSYVAKINFFNPRTAKKQQAPTPTCTTSITTYVCNPKPKIPTWTEAKQQVFSSSSSSALSDCDREMSDYKNNKSDNYGLWMAAANRSDNHHSHLDAASPRSDGDIWAEPAATPSSDGDIWAEPAASPNSDGENWAEPANSADHTDSISASASSRSPNESDDVSISFNPPEILGHHQFFINHPTDPNATILES